MASITIPQLPQALALNGSEQLECVQSGTSKRITTQQIANLPPGSAPGSVSFATLAAAEAAYIPVGTLSVILLGYYQAGDGGGGQYIPASTGAGAGKFPSADGQWWRISGSIFTPLQFGAVGDGVMSDTASVQACLNYGLSIVIPSGHTFLVGALTARSGQSITLSGVLKSTLGHTDIITNSGALTGFTLIGNGGALDGNVSSSGSTGLGRGVFIQGASNIIIRDIQCHDTNGDGISVYDASEVIISGNIVSNSRDNGIKGEANTTSCSSWVIDGNTVNGTTAQNGIFLFADTGHTFTNWSASSNTVNGVADEGIEIGQRLSDGTVVANAVNGAANVGILVRGAQRVAVDANKTTGCPIGIDIATYTSGDNAVSDIVVSGNSCTGGGSSVGAGVRVSASTGASVTSVRVIGNKCSGNLNGITAIQGQRIYIDENDCSENFTNGILVQDCQVGTVLGNSCMNNYQTASVATDPAGIYLTTNSGACDGFKVSGNTCSDTQVSKTQVNGITINNLTNSEISNNDLSGNKTNPYLALGSNTGTWGVNNQIASGRQVFMSTWSQGQIDFGAFGSGTDHFTIPGSPLAATGVVAGDKLEIIPPSTTAGIFIQPLIPSNDHVQAYVQNLTSGTPSQLAGTWKAIVTKAGMLAVSV